jgi:iron(III) transport system ATP-binding protein
MDSNLALQIKDLDVRYPGTHISAVQDISFELAQGEIACLLGPSGCGKTTLLRAIAGFFSPHLGESWLKGNAASTPERVLSP